jgi:hypothetical protein
VNVAFEGFTVTVAIAPPPLGSEPNARMPTPPSHPASAKVSSASGHLLDFTPRCPIGSLIPRHGRDGSVPA